MVYKYLTKLDLGKKNTQNKALNAKHKVKSVKKNPNMCSSIPFLHVFYPSGLNYSQQKCSTPLNINPCKTNNERSSKTGTTPTISLITFVKENRITWTNIKENSRNKCACILEENMKRIT